VRWNIPDSATVPINERGKLRGAGFASPGIERRIYNALRSARGARIAVDRRYLDGIHIDIIVALLTE